MSPTEAENMAGQQFPHVGICLSGTGIQIHHNQGMIAIPSNEVTQEDVNRVLDMAQNGITPLTNQTVLKIIPESFLRDLSSITSNHQLVWVQKLEVNAYIFTIPTTALNNVRKGFKDVGIDVVDVFPSLPHFTRSSPFSSSKEPGVVCIDIDLLVLVWLFSKKEPPSRCYHPSRWRICHFRYSSRSTSFCRCRRKTQDRLRWSHILWSPSNQKTKKSLSVVSIKRNRNSFKTLSRSDSSGSLQRDSLSRQRWTQKLGRDGMLPEGAVFVGGGSKAHNLIELNKIRTPSPMFYRLPRRPGNMWRVLLFLIQDLLVRLVPSLLSESWWHE